MPFKKIDVKATIEQQCTQNKDFKEAWEASKMEYAIIGQLIEIRKLKHLSQGDLASKNNTTQQAISRVENMSVNPSLKTICGIADSLGYEVKLVPKA